MEEKAALAGREVEESKKDSKFEPGKTMVPGGKN
jgi:hypothetical protein